jgi:hypothetical protein
VVVRAVRDLEALDVLHVGECERDAILGGQTTRARGSRGRELAHDDDLALFCGGATARSRRAASRDDEREADKGGND